ARVAHEDAIAADRFNQLVIAGFRPQLGRYRVAVEELHRVVLERPDAVVAHHPDHAEPVARHRVELHPGKAEGAVAEQQADLAVRVGDLRPDRLTRPGAEAAEGARVHPTARFVGIDEPARIGDEVASIADYHRIAVENFAQLL